MNTETGTKLIYINSDYSNGQYDDTGAEYLASLPNPIQAENEHSGYRLALHTFNFTNALYNVESADRWVYLCKSASYPTGIYVEINIPAGFYTLTELLNVYPTLSIYNHGLYLGNKPTTSDLETQNRTVSNFYITEIFTNTLTGITVNVPVLPTTISFSTTTACLSFSYPSQTVTGPLGDSSSSLYYQYASTVVEFVTTGDNNNNLLKLLGVTSSTGSVSKYGTYQIIAKVTVTEDDATQWLYSCSTKELYYVINLQKTNVIYIRLDLLKGCNKSSTDSFHESDIFAIVPFSETFGEIITYIPQNLIWHTINYQNITNFRIILTDGHGNKINFNDVGWHLTLAYEPVSFDYSLDNNPIENQRMPNVLSHADSRYMDPLNTAMDYVPTKRGRY